MYDRLKQIDNEMNSRPTRVTFELDDMPVGKMKERYNEWRVSCGLEAEDPDDITSTRLSEWVRDCFMGSLESMLEAPKTQKTPRVPKAPVPTSDRFKMGFRHVMDDPRGKEINTTMMDEKGRCWLVMTTICDPNDVETVKDFHDGLIMLTNKYT